MIWSGYFGSSILLFSMCEADLTGETCLTMRGMEITGFATIHSCKSISRVTPRNLIVDKVMWYFFPFDLFIRAYPSWYALIGRQFSLLRSVWGSGTRAGTLWGVLIGEWYLPNDMVMTLSSHLWMILYKSTSPCEPLEENLVQNNWKYLRL
jgi:hypothetical protein